MSHGEQGMQLSIQVRAVGDASVASSIRSTTRAWTAVSVRVNLVSLACTATTAQTGEFDYCNALLPPCTVQQNCSRDNDNDVYVTLATNNSRIDKYRTVVE